MCVCVVCVCVCVVCVCVYVCVCIHTTANNTANLCTVVYVKYSVSFGHTC